MSLESEFESESAIRRRVSGTKPLEEFSIGTTPTSADLVSVGAVRWSEQVLGRL